MTIKTMIRTADICSAFMSALSSCVKDFKPLKTGVIHLEKGTGELTMKATDIPGSMVMDMRLMIQTRAE